MRDQKFMINQRIEQNEINEIKHYIGSREGIIAVRLDLEEQTITVDYDDERYDKNQLLSIISDAGINVTNMSDTAT